MLTYHEAFTAQGAVEILGSGQWSGPTIGGQPWLEKPPLPFWLVASLGWLTGQVTPELARLPSAVAASTLALGVLHLATRHYGLVSGLLAGAIQATTSWWVFRGRLAEGDITLACVITWALVAFDHLRDTPTDSTQDMEKAQVRANEQLWRCIFFGLLGLSALVKGIGFGACLVFSVAVPVILWGREWRTLQRLVWAPGWALAGVFSSAWPLTMIVRHGTPVFHLWLMHISDRVIPSGSHGQFAGEPWGSYALNVFGQGLPWAPLALIGVLLAIQKRRRAVRLMHNCCDTEQLCAMAGGRLLWVWTLVPLALVSIPRARNAHYAIHAMVPWSLWASTGLLHLAGLLRTRGWRVECLKGLAVAGFCLLPLVCGLGYWLAGPHFDHRRPETTFYEHVRYILQPTEDLALLYDEWDREPYYTPFGQIPHDLALRLFYLKHPVCWHFGVASLSQHENTCAHAVPSSAGARSFLIIARDRDLAALRSVGTVEVLAQSATARWDRQYVLIRFQAYVLRVTHADARALKSG